MKNTLKLFLVVANALVKGAHTFMEEIEKHDGIVVPALTDLHRAARELAETDPEVQGLLAQISENVELVKKECEEYSMSIEEQVERNLEA